MYVNLDRKMLAGINRKTLLRYLLGGLLIIALAGILIVTGVTNSLFGETKEAVISTVLVASVAVLLTGCLFSLNYQRRVRELALKFAELIYADREETRENESDELEMLRDAYASLEDELHTSVAEREKLQQELRHSGEELEQRVVARTRELLEQIRDLNVELEERRRIEKKRFADFKELKEKMNSVKTLSGLIPICASCKRIRDEDGYWNELEAYIEAHSDIVFSHGICPECIEKLYPVKQPVKSPMRGVPYLR